MYLDALQTFSNNHHYNVPLLWLPTDQNEP